MKRPPEIIHGLGRPDLEDIPSFIEAVRANVGLCSQEYRLLLFYAMSGEGFHPAKATIKKETGIDTSDIKVVRRNLRHMNLIDFADNAYFHFVFVNWTVIRGLAILDQPLKVGGRSRKYFTPCDFSQYKRHPYHGMMDDFLIFLRRLTRQEVRHLLRGDAFHAFRHMEKLENSRRKRLGMPPSKSVFLIQEASQDNTSSVEDMPPFPQSPPSDQINTLPF